MLVFVKNDILKFFLCWKKDKKSNLLTFENQVHIFKRKGVVLMHTVVFSV